MIIPFFIPHSGCPHQCIFCNQKNITGRRSPIEPSDIPREIEKHLHTKTSKEPVEVAFYGGTFTALQPHVQHRYLAQILPFIRSGRIGHIRVSTRPDCIDRDILALLKEHCVEVVELGAQSMNDDVLARSGRGHTAADTLRAVRLLQEEGFRTGLQLMPGLPGDSMQTIGKTIDTVSELKPESVRLYPALVIKDTPLADFYRRGLYEPLTLEQAVAVCKDAYRKFAAATIKVIRMGLQPTEDLEKPGMILSGPYHPAFRQLVESAILLDGMRAALKAASFRRATPVFRIHPKDLSSAIGQRRGNVERLRKEFTLTDVCFAEDPGVGRLGVVLRET